jgi:hypothetical protein
MILKDWKAEQLNEFEIRITAPDGEAWRFVWVDENAGLAYFMWKLAQDAVRSVEI